MRLSVVVLLSLISTSASHAQTSAPAQRPPSPVVATQEGIAARKAFEASPDVKAAIAKLVAAGRVLADEPDAVVISMSCGIVGCDFRILVVQRQSTKGPNTSSASVTALVDVTATGKTTVKLVSLGG